MNQVRYRAPERGGTRTKVGGRAQAVKTFKIVYITNATMEFALDDATKKDSIRAGHFFRIAPRKTGPQAAEKSPAAKRQTVKTRQGSAQIQKAYSSLLIALLESSVTMATVRSKEVHELKAEDGTRYPLKMTIDLAQQKIGDSIRYYLPHSEVLETLVGEDRDDKAALRNFAAGFHRMVKTHWQKPAHLHTDADEKVNGVLEHLVDWERYRQVNPIEQPLWGKIIERRSDKSITVEWMIGPHVERGATTAMKPKDVCSQLREISVGCWFYGSGKVYPSKIEWIDQPVESPDPYDRDAIAQAWDLIPRSVLSEMDAWPLRNGE